MSLLTKAIEFYNLKSSWLGAGADPVPLEQAQNRTDVCTMIDSGKRCPNNQEKPIFELFAGAVAKTVLKQLKAKDEMGLKVKREECLHVCSVCSCVLKLKVHVPLKYILENTNTDGLPSWCWIVREKESLQNDNKDQRIQEQ